MSDELGMGAATAMLIAMAFRSRAEIQRRQLDPEYAMEAEAREIRKAEEKFNAQYEQAGAENAEYDRSPRAFLRRLSKFKGGQS